MARRDPFAAAEAALRKFALAFPESTEDFPWDHRAIKVRGKMFLILSRDGERFNATVKLPVSGSQAIQMAFAEPTGYGLGKHGWVTASFNPDMVIPLDLLREWIDESFRAVAPKTVLAKLEQAESGEAARASRRRSGRNRRSERAIPELTLGAYRCVFSCDPRPPPLRIRPVRRTWLRSSRRRGSRTSSPRRPRFAVRWAGGRRLPDKPMPP